MSFSIFETTVDWAERAGLACVAEPAMASTNDLAKANAFKEDEPLALYVTDHQTAGRGRGSNSWTDKGEGRFLLSSWSFQLLQAPQPVLAPALGLALYKAASSTWLGFRWSLKAPNDLYLDDRKVAGLLIESVQEGANQRLIVGLGLNVMSKPDLPQAGSILQRVPAEEISPEIWRQFLDRLLLELTSALLLTEMNLQPSQRRGLLHALNRFPLLKTSYSEVLADGGLQLEDGKTVSWFDL